MVKTEIDVTIYSESWRGEVRTRCWDFTCARSKQTILRFEARTDELSGLLYGRDSGGVSVKPGSVRFEQEGIGVVLEADEILVSAILFGSGRVESVSGYADGPKLNPRIGHHKRVVCLDVHRGKLRNPDQWLAQLIRKGKVPSEILEVDEGCIDVRTTTSNYGTTHTLEIFIWPVRVG